MAAGERERSEPAPLNETSVELRGEREIVIARIFDAPARVVFDAWTRPELVRRWWAPPSLGVSLVGCDAAVEVGGAYRYVCRLGTGAEFAFSGRYLEITPHSRLVYTQVFEPAASGPGPDDAEVVITVTFDERAGRTRLVSHTLCPSREVRDGIIASGMEHGLRETMGLLDELVTSMA